MTSRPLLAPTPLPPFLRSLVELARRILKRVTNNNANLQQLILYGVIGGLSASLDFAVFLGLFELLHLHYQVANAISVHAGITLSFILNRRYNFKVFDKVGARFLRFYLTGLFGLLISFSILRFGSALGYPPPIVKVASIVIVALVQFIINKMVTFRNS